MKKPSALGFVSFAIYALSTPILAWDENWNPGNGGTTGYTNITGNGGYMRAIIETEAGKQCDEISCSGRFYIVNGDVIGYPKDLNRWSTKAHAQMTYSTTKVVACETTHIADGDNM